MANSTGVIIGVGPERGLGASLCRRFAGHDLHILVAGRTLEKVEAVAEDIRRSGGQATAVMVDATEEEAVRELFQKAESVAPIELAIYNAGNNMPGDFLGMEAEYFERCWRIACFGGFLFSREALRLMVPREKGTLLFTGATASLQGNPDFAAFAAAKSGLRALAQSVARQFGPKGIHVAHVVIDGAIDGDRIQIGRPQVAQERGFDGLVDLEGIVDIYEMLFKQIPRAWTHELDVRPSKGRF